jgi:DNA-binding LacI/PurR family transcriptional regulator
MENSRIKKLLVHGDAAKAARKAGVSKMAVSMFLNDPDARLSEEIKVRIVTAIEEVTAQRKATSDVLKKKMQRLLKKANAA